VRTSSTQRAGLGLRISTFLVVAFLYVPLGVIVLYSFTTQTAAFTFPPPALTTHWWGSALEKAQLWSSLRLSLTVAALATLLAISIGGLLAAAVYRATFPGRNVLAFLVVLPIALPGIVTGIALRSAFNQLGIDPSTWTLVIGHTTFCIVIAYNNVVARLRRMSPNLVEASSDLGASGWQTFRHVVWPNLATAVLAGAILAFALSFDEIIVTTLVAGQQQTLPIYIFSILFRPRSKPEVNVIALLAIAITFVPVLLAQLLTRDEGGHVR
jgi:putative spermidine/putrescine transport system permease protein